MSERAGEARTWVCARVAPDETGQNDDGPGPRLAHELPSKPFKPCRICRRVNDGVPDLSPFK